MGLVHMGSERQSPDHISAPSPCRHAHGSGGQSLRTSWHGEDGVGEGSGRTVWSTGAGLQLWWGRWGQRSGGWVGSMAKWAGSVRRCVLNCSFISPPSGHRRQVHGAYLHRSGQVWCLGLFWRVQPSGGGGAVCRLHADTDDTGRPQGQSPVLRAAGQTG